MRSYCGNPHPMPDMLLLHGPSSFASHKRAAVAANAENSGFWQRRLLYSSIPPFLLCPIPPLPPASKAGAISLTGP